MRLGVLKTGRVVAPQASRCRRGVRWYLQGFCTPWLDMPVLQSDEAHAVRFLSDPRRERTESSPRRHL
jgi:hypothetical protein